MRNDDRLTGFPCEKIPDQNSFGFHRKCYQYYTDKGKIKQASGRSKDMTEDQHIRQSSRKCDRTG